MSKPVIVKMEVGNHGNCKLDIHDNCALKDHFIDLFQKLYNTTVTRSEMKNNLLKLEIRGDTPDKLISKQEVDFRISDFFRHHTITTLVSLKVGARKW